MDLEKFRNILLLDFKDRVGQNFVSHDHITVSKKAVLRCEKLEIFPLPRFTTILSMVNPINLCFRSWGACGMFRAIATV